MGRQNESNRKAHKKKLDQKKKSDQQAQSRRKEKLKTILKNAKASHSISNE